jgi:S1-C subfamily serine protease
MVGVVTAVLAGSTAGLLVAVTSGPSLALSLAIPIPVALAILVCLLRYVRRRWLRAGSIPLTADEPRNHDATGGRENLARWMIRTAAEA